MKVSFYKTALYESFFLEGPAWMTLRLNFSSTYLVWLQTMTSKEGFFSSISAIKTDEHLMLLDMNFFWNQCQGSREQFSRFQNVGNWTIQMFTFFWLSFQFELKIGFELPSLREVKQMRNYLPFEVLFFSKMVQMMLLLQTVECMVLCFVQSSSLLQPKQKKNNKIVMKQ